MKDSSKAYQSDFQDLSPDEMDAMIAEKKSTLRSLDSEKRDLQMERKEQVQIVKALRSAVVGIERSGSGRKILLGEFHSMRKQAKIHREKRDEINLRIPPPSKILEEWLGETYLTLTKIDNDLTTVPMLNPELSAFSRFFEIQSSIKKKREAEKSHSEYISKLTEMRKISTKLDQNKEEIIKAKSGLKENAEMLGENNRIDLIEKEFSGLISISEISKRVMGKKYFMSATEEQRKRFNNKFKETFFNTYSSALSNLEDQKIEVIGHAHPKDKPNAAIVRVRITSGEDSYDLNYQMIKKKNRWGVINIIFSGVILKLVRIFTD